MVLGADERMELIRRIDILQKTLLCDTNNMEVATAFVNFYHDQVSVYCLPAIRYLQDNKMMDDCDRDYQTLISGRMKWETKSWKNLPQTGNPLES